MPDLQSRSSVRNSTRRPPAGGVKRSRGAGTADAALVPRNTAMTPARILIVDDDADFRWLLLTLLEADFRVRVAGEAGEVMPRSDGLGHRDGAVADYQAALGRRRGRDAGEMVSGVNTTTRERVTCRGRRFFLLP
jgi:hypothetical protein